jgi:hypothetical protein
LEKAVHQRLNVGILICLVPVSSHVLLRQFLEREVSILKHLDQVCRLALNELGAELDRMLAARIEHRVNPAAQPSAGFQQDHPPAGFAKATGRSQTRHSAAHH